MRIGHGYDVHRLVEGRALILGGVCLPYDRGLDGHSDADVLLHAVMDAMLGAAALGDIGKHFPDTDQSYKNISSLFLLKKVKDLINNYSIVNIDCTIIAQKPKLSEHIYNMRKTLSSILEINIDQINIKATTEEGLGFTGRLEGIAVHSVALISN